MKKIQLNDKQAAYKSVILKVIKKELTSLQAAHLLCVTQRCIEYKVTAYKLFGDESLIHGNLGKTHESEKFKILRQRIKNIFLYTKIDNQSLNGKLT